MAEGDLVSTGIAALVVTRELTIGGGGFTLVPVDEAQALPILPFSSYYGLLSRAPMRLSPGVLPDGSRPAIPAVT